MLLKSSPLYDLLDFEFVTIRRQMCPHGMMEWWNGGVMMKKDEKEQFPIVKNTSEPHTPPRHCAITATFPWRDEAELTIRL